jgi:hypothetical protein
MVRIRENKQKQLTSQIMATQLLRTDLTSCTARMFVCITKVQVKESAP